MSWRTVHKLKTILKEDEVTDKLGKVAFGEDPFVAKMQFRKSEENTDYEEHILDILSRWTGNSTDGLANKLYAKFPLLKKAAQMFPYNYVLTPNTDNGTMLYRGVGSYKSLSLDKQLSKTKKEEWERIKFGGLTIYKYKKPIKYVPHRSVQSWTSLKSVATLFTSGRGVILSTIQTDEFLFNQKLMNHLYGGKAENEVLHFGTKYKEDVYVGISPLLWKELWEKN